MQKLRSRYGSEQTEQWGANAQHFSFDLLQVYRKKFLLPCFLKVRSGLPHTLRRLQYVENLRLPSLVSLLR